MNYIQANYVNQIDTLLQVFEIISRTCDYKYLVV
jgi:hypothetical protein